MSRSNVTNAKHDVNWHTKHKQTSIAIQMLNKINIHSHTPTTTNNSRTNPNQTNLKTKKTKNKKNKKNTKNAK